MTNDEEDGFRERLEQRDYEAAVLRDRWLLSVTGVALGLSLTFIRELSGPLNAPWLVITAWGFLGTSVLAMLASLGRGRAAMQKMMQESTEGQRLTGGLARPFTIWLNRAAFGLFAFGLISLVIFASVNLPGSGS